MDGASDKDRNKAVGLAPDDKDEHDFLIARRTDGRWEVDYSKGKHKRIYDSLIDATMGVMDVAAEGVSSYSIRIGR